MEISRTRRSCLVEPDACCRHLEGGMFTWDHTSVLRWRTDERGYSGLGVWLVWAALRTNLSLLSAGGVFWQNGLCRQTCLVTWTGTLACCHLLLPVYRNVKEIQKRLIWNRCLRPDSCAAVASTCTLVRYINVVVFYPYFRLYWKSRCSFSSKLAGFSLKSWWELGPCTPGEFSSFVG